MALNAEQQANAKAIYDQGVAMNLDIQTIGAAIATAMMESGLRNLTGGDRDSVGLFQQRPSQGWGTPAQINDPRYAARKFFEAYVKSKGSTVLERIANTQRPAAEHRNQYANHFAAAEQAVSDLSGGISAPLTGAASTVSAASTGAAVTTAEAEALTPESTPAEIEAYIRKTYPDWAWLLANPELRSILTRPDIDDLDETEIRALVEGTDYWKTHSPASRAFDNLLGTEPQAGGQLVDTVKGILGDEFVKAGVPITDEQLGMVAKNALRAGWVSLQGQILHPGKVADFITFALRQQPQNLDGGQLPAGSIAADADALGAIAQQYGVPVPRASVEDWAMRVTEGTATRETFTQYVVNLAKAQWLHDPDVIKAMDQGVSPSQFFAPHVARIAETLELSPGQIDLFNDPKYASITQMYDPEVKTRRSMTLGEVAQWARDQEEYANTRAYKEQDAAFTMKMAKTFGAVA